MGGWQGTEEVGERMDEIAGCVSELRVKANTFLTDNQAAARHLGIN